MSERGMTYLAWGVSAVLVLAGVWARFFPSEQTPAGCAACPAPRVIVAVVHTGAAEGAPLDSLDVFRLDCGPSQPGVEFPEVRSLDPRGGSQ